MRLTVAERADIRWCLDSFETYTATHDTTQRLLDSLDEAEEAIEFHKGVQVEMAREYLCELKRLHAAIETHRRNVWGSGEVGHDEDVALYAVLEEEG